MMENSINSIGTPLCSIIATRTPSDGGLGFVRIVNPRVANSKSKSSTTKAICGTVWISSCIPHSSSNLIHSAPKGLEAKPETENFRWGQIGFSRPYLPGRNAYMMVSPSPLHHASGQFIVFPVLFHIPNNLPATNLRLFGNNRKLVAD